MAINDESSRTVHQGEPGGPRDQDNSPRALPQHVLVGLLHPQERGRAMLVWVSAALTALVLLYVTVSFTFVLLIILFVGVSIWIGKQLAYALFRGGAVQIGPAQFPDIHEHIVEAATRLAGLRRQGCLGLDGRAVMIESIVGW